MLVGKTSFMAGCWEAWLLVVRGDPEAFEGGKVEGELGMRASDVSPRSIGRVTTWGCTWWVAEMVHHS